MVQYATMEFERRPAHQRNPDLEILLQQINGILNPVEAAIVAKHSKPKYPSLFILGAPRSGTTLMLQWLASTHRFAYPTNLLSRFYGAPYIGALVQRLLTDPRYDFNRELFDLSPEATFQSNLGKTTGALSPHGFWYFWRRFFPLSELQPLDEAQFDPAAVRDCLAELAAVEAVFDKPLAMKGAHMNFNIPFFATMFQQAVFVYVTRHPFYNMQSLFEARLNYFGDLRAWYSGRPPEYSELENLDPYHQIAGQVYYTNEAVARGLGAIEEKRFVRVNYETFCRDPRVTYSEILDALAARGWQTDDTYSGPTSFSPTNQVRLDGGDCDRLVEAYQHFARVRLTV